MVDPDHPPFLSIRCHFLFPRLNERIVGIVHPDRASQGFVAAVHRQELLAASKLAIQRRLKLRKAPLGSSSAQSGSGSPSWQRNYCLQQLNEYGISMAVLFSFRFGVIVTREQNACLAQTHDKD